MSEHSYYGLKVMIAAHFPEDQLDKSFEALEDIISDSKSEGYDRGLADGYDLGWEASQHDY